MDTLVPNCTRVDIIHREFEQIDRSEVGEFLPSKRIPGSASTCSLIGCQSTRSGRHFASGWTHSAKWAGRSCCPVFGANGAKLGYGGEWLSLLE